jgi:hypothetical protein
MADFAGLLRELRSIVAEVDRDSVAATGEGGVSLPPAMNEQTSLGTEPDVTDANARDAEDYWQSRALEAERRLEDHKVLEDEQAAVRRRGTELLQESLLAVESERNEWRARAEIAEARVTEYLAEVEQQSIELGTELDGWRRRALAAEELIQQQQNEIEAQRLFEREGQEHQTATTEDVPLGDAPRPRPEVPAARRPRGNWLR